MTAAAVEPATDEAGRLAVLRARLVTPMPDDRPWGWLGPLLVTAFGTFLRFNRLSVPGHVLKIIPSGHAAIHPALSCRQYQADL